MSRPRTGSARPHGDGWQARWTDSSGERQSRGGFASKEDALAYAQDQLSDMRRGEYLNPTQARQPFKKYADDWMAAAEVELRASTLNGYRRILEKHLTPRFGETPIGEIDHGAVQRLILDLADGRSGNTVKRINNVLRQVMKHAIHAGAIRHNPCDHVRLPRTEPGETVALTPEQVDRIASAMPGRHALVVTFAAYTGLRAGEVWGLRVRSLDLLRRSVRIAETVNDLGSNGLTFGPPKSRASRRTVGLPRFLVEELAAFLAVTYPGGADPDAFVFPGEEGGVTRHNVWYGRYWKPTVDAIRREDPAFPKVRFHDLRHTAASLLINAGADPRAVAERLGHSNVMLTLNTYSHMFETRDADLTDALDETYVRRAT